VDYQQAIATVDVQCLKFVDESGVNLAMTRLYGRAPKGVRVSGTVPQNYGPNVTLLAALGDQGLHAVMTVEGATDIDVFRAYVKHVLGPTLVFGDVLVLDNLGAHKAMGVQQMLAKRRVRLRYLPPYSPNLPPIELCWSKLKTAFRKRRGRGKRSVSVPDTIQGIIMARLNRLREDGKRTVQLASVIGRQFLHRLLERVAGLTGQLEGLLQELKPWKSSTSRGSSPSPPTSPGILRQSPSRNGCSSSPGRRMTDEVRGRRSWIWRFPILV
jgi:transposase